MIRIRSEASAILALIAFIVAGLLWWGTEGLALGRAARMGPAFLPRMVALLLAAVGFALLVRSLVMEGDRFGKLPWRALTAVLGGIAAFALLVDSVGLLAAVPALVIMASAGDRTLSPMLIFVIALVLTVFAAVLFVTLLGLPLDLWVFGA